MSFRTLSLLCTALCVALVLGDLDPPASVKLCQKDSSDYASCLRLAIQEAWPSFIKGLPEYGIPTLDPYHTDFYENTFENGEMKGSVTTKDVNAYGLAKTRFLSVKATHGDNAFRLEVDVETPKLLIEGDYKVEGSLGSFKIGGKGYFNISMDDVRTVWDIEGPVENDKWVVKHFRIAPEIGRMQVYFSDLFNGNQEMTQAALAFINEYWPTIYRGMMPYMTEMWDKHLTNLANDFFSKVSFSKIFP